MKARLSSAAKREAFSQLVFWNVFFTFGATEKLHSELSNINDHYACSTVWTNKLRRQSLSRRYSSMLFRQILLSLLTYLASPAHSLTPTFYLGQTPASAAKMVCKTFPFLNAGQQVLTKNLNALHHKPNWRKLFGSTYSFKRCAPSNAS